MRLPECPDATLPAADRLSRAPLRSGKQLVAPPATHTDKPAGPATYDALVSVLALLVLMLLTGCAAVPERLEPLPAALSADASLPGIGGGRYWGDERPYELDAWLAQPEATLRERYGGVMGRPHNYLVISGGGDGACGARLLTGWTEAGPGPNSRSSPASAPARSSPPSPFSTPTTTRCCARSTRSSPPRT